MAAYQQNVLGTQIGIIRRMIVAGIDEAGYGPLLGPLAVGCCAFAINGPDAGAADNVPCLWSALRKVVSKNRTKAGRRLHINDSKAVYSPAIGLRELERSVLATACAWSGGDCDGELGSFLGRVAPAVVGQLRQYPWYAPYAGERFPLEQDAITIRMIANALRLEMQRVGTACVHLSAQVLLERDLNRQFAVTRNKSSVLFTLTAIHLERLMRTYAQQGLVIMCDRHGGREHYGHLLRLMFPEWSLQIISERDGAAAYVLERQRQQVHLHFRERAESQCLPVAMASMLSKYLREAMMRRFNAWWRGLLPELAPTAGYYNDGVRFLNDTALKRQELGIADEQLVRAR